MPTKIAIVTPTFPPYRGGIGKVAEEDAIQLAALGHDVHVYAPAKSAAAPLDAPFKLHVLPSWFRIGNAAFVPAAGKLLKEYPVVILHYPFYGGAESLVLAARRQDGGKLVLTYHMDTVGSGLKRAFFAAHRGWCLPLAMRVASKVIVTTVDYARAGYLAPYIKRNQHLFFEMPPSVDIRRFRPGPKPGGLLFHHRIARTEPIILFVGGLDQAHYFKGVRRLLEAMTATALAGAKLVIVGEGGLRRGYEQYADELGIRSRTVFAGGVAEEELPAYFRLADVFAFPSIDRSEAFGIAALEALSSGVPVVASNLPGVRTIVRDGETGLLSAPGSASSLAEQSGRLLADAGLRRRLGDAGRSMVESSYADEARRDRWRRLLNELSLP